MRLRRLEVFGFKSFADRTDFLFETGLTGLVGPNGCGKTNVVEAIRWVLGEQRPTTLRGEEMADVLFKGADGRPPLGVAEATIVFEDEAARLPEGRTEASVTRRLFRTGESEYLLNGRACRLKDVRDFLFDTGLGVQGYSSMEQGRIDAILSADPLERRSVFEEAAGISRFRMRRRETLRRIEQVEQDCLRVGDLLGELEHRVRSLRTQAGRARKYGEQVKALRERRIRFALHLRSRSEEGRREVEAEVARLEERAKALREARAKAEEEARAREGEGVSLAAESERLSAEIERLREAERACLERAAAGRERAVDSDRAAERDGAALAEARPRLADLERSRSRLGVEAEAAASRQKSAAAALASAEDRVRETSLRHREEADKGIEGNRRLLEAMQARTEARNRLVEAQAARRTADARLERAKAREAALAESEGSATAEAQALERAVSEADGRRRGSENERNAARARLEGLETRLSELEGSARAEESSRASLLGRIETLRALEVSREGIEEGPREILEARLPGIAGLLADRIRPRSPLARALEAALGPFVHSLFSKSPEAARDALAWLKRRGDRRATIGVPSLLRRPEVPPKLRERGVEGRLVDLLGVEGEILSLLEASIGDVFVAASFEDAVRLSTEVPHLRFVTRSGELAGRGFLSGGGPGGGALFTRRAALEDLEGEAEEVSARLAALRKEERETREGLRIAREEAAAFAAASAEAEREVAGLLGRTEEGRRRRDEIARERAVLGEEVRAAGEGVSALAREEEVAARALERSDASFASLEEVAHGAEARRLERERERDEARRLESEARVSFAKEEEQARGLEERKRALEAALAAARAEVEGVERAIAEAARSGGAAREEAGGLERRARESASKRETLEARKRLLAPEEAAAREKAAEARGAVETKARELEEAGGALGEARLREQKLRLEREEGARRIRDDYAVELDSLSASFVADPSFDASAAETEIAETRARIERFGPVNLEALRELEEAEERLGFLTKQKADLEEAKASLKDAVRRLDLESRSKFEETFKAVQENFRTVFRQLFQGGKAEVSLEEGADLLEAGIEIVAKPPGKELQSIELLSGGERTLTAIALLFALFRAKPSPFCLLDEVDASLDDANVERFLGLLREYVRDTQFILVTHNRRSMSECSTLYGVTMEDSGVSRLVAVKLEEAEALSTQETTVEVVPATRAEIPSPKGVPAVRG